MNKRTFAVLIAVLTFVVGVVLAKLSLPHGPSALLPPVKQDLLSSDYKLSGPYSHENLTIFLVRGPDQANSKLYMPLQKAMERKLVIVHETSDVNELAIENVSQSEEVLVQAGDIVKGGQQDRVLAVDLIVPARSGKIPIAAFCVESGRWEQRGEERSAQFSTSNDMVTTKELKLAAKQSKSQSKVWAEVDAAQGMMSRSVGREVRANLSQSSLQLAIENEKVQESSAPYLKKLSSIVDGKSDVIGFALAVNNKLNSADIYATSTQFKTFWPKLLRTAAIEAVAQRPLNETGEPVSNATVAAFFVDCGRGDESINDVTKRTRMMKRESDQSLFFETRDMDRGGVWIHRSYLTK